MTRVAAGVLKTVSIILTLILWAYSVWLLYQLWGILGLLVSVIFTPVVAVPLALLAAIFHGYWAVFSEVLIGGLLAGLLFGLGVWVRGKDQGGRVEKLRAELAVGDALECPRCGLVNPPTAERCDCGYRF